MSTPNQRVKRLRQRVKQLDKMIARHGLRPDQVAMCTKEREALVWAIDLLDRLIARFETAGGPQVGSRPEHV